MCLYKIVCTNISYVDIIKDFYAMKIVSECKAMAYDPVVSVSLLERRFVCSTANGLVFVMDVL